MKKFLLICLVAIAGIAILAHHKSEQETDDWA